MTCDYQAYVGPKDKYYTLGAKTFLRLVEYGVLPSHKVLDVGCGSLRTGRTLIPYLDPNNYFGIEPEKDQLSLGLSTELSDIMVESKKPSFTHSPIFDISSFPPFDWVLAIQVFIHCGEEQLRDFLLKMSGRTRRIVLTLSISENSSQVNHKQPERNRRYKHASHQRTTYSLPHSRKVIAETGWKVLEDSLFVDSEKHHSLLLRGSETEIRKKPNC